MVYLIKFPNSLTKEEHLLKMKYKCLQEKKNILQGLQGPAKQVLEKSKQDHHSLKRHMDPSRAKEFAKNLVLSGKISIPAKSNDHKTVFKKSKMLDRKLDVLGKMISDDDFKATTTPEK